MKILVELAAEFLYNAAAESLQKQNRQGEQKMTKRVSIFAIVILLSLITIPLAWGSAWYNDDSDAGNKNTDWMSYLPDYVFISELSIPGTHDTMARVCEWGAIDPMCWAKCQDLTQDEQLNAGVRAFDIRCKMVLHEDEGVYFRMYHGDIDQRRYFGDVLESCINFLMTNEKETILMRVKPVETKDAFGVTFTQIFDKYMGFPLANIRIINKEGQVKDFIWDGPYTAIPMLEDVRGKIVILDDFTEEGEQSRGLLWREADIQDDWELIPATYGSIEEKWRKVKKHIEHTDEELRGGNKGKLYINFLSGSGHLQPYFVAGGFAGHPGVNYRCYYFFEGLGERKMPCGLMMMDFPGGGLIQYVIENNYFPPVMDLGPLYEEVCTSEFFNRLCTFTDDPGSSEWTITIDYGDGSGEQEFTTYETGFLLNHKYDVGTYIITVRIVDESSAEATGEITVSSKPCIRNIRIRTSG